MARGIKMNVRFIDTSIMLNFLEVPGRCAEKERVKEEWRFILEKKETLIMPIATIIDRESYCSYSRWDSYTYYFRDQTSFSLEEDYSRDRILLKDAIQKFGLVVRARRL